MLNNSFQRNYQIEYFQHRWLTFASLCLGYYFTVLATYFQASVGILSIGTELTALGACYRTAYFHS